MTLSVQSVESSALRDRVAELKVQGHRFVTFTALAGEADKVRILYHFALGFELVHLGLDVV